MSEDNAAAISSEMRSLAFGKDAIEYCAPEALTAYSNNARTHDEKQIEVLMGSIRRFGFINPALVDRSGVIVAGHGRVEAARRLGLAQIPVLRIEGLSDDELRGYRLADNRIAELAGWDEGILAIELQYLVDVDFALDVTGWKGPEIDEFILGNEDEAAADAAEVIPEIEQVAVSRLGDLWLMGRHRLMCGTALESSCYARLMGDEQATLICQDPPWNVAVSSISGSGKTKHREFVMASGEMSDAEYRNFIVAQLACNIERAVPGAVIQSFVDWRGVEKVITAGTSLGLDLLNVLVWYKGHGSFGSPWRSAHELVVCFAVPGGKIKDRVRMGEHGRIRSNVLEVPGMGSFGKGRMEALASHPTSKPIRLLTELIRDVTDRGDVVLDSFMGSGSCLIAAERTGRIARGLELDPLYVDTIVRRWEKVTGGVAVLDGDGRSFAEVAAARGVEGASPSENARIDCSLPDDDGPGEPQVGRSTGIRRRANSQAPAMSTASVEDCHGA